MPCISSHLDQMVKMPGSFNDVVEKLFMVSSFTSSLLRKEGTYQEFFFFFAQNSVFLL